MKLIRARFLAATAVALLAVAPGSGLAAEVDPRIRLIPADTWTVCTSMFYVPRAANAPRSGEIAQYFWSKPFRTSKPMNYIKLQWDNLRLHPDIADQYLDQTASAMNLDKEHFADLGCQFYRSFDEASTRTAQQIQQHAAIRHIVDPPSAALLAKAPPGRTNPVKNTDRATQTKEPSAPARNDADAARLASGEALRRENAEIAERNRRASEEHQQRVDAYNAEKAAHERRIAEHRGNVARAAAEEQEHSTKMAANSEEVAAHRKAMEDYSERLKSPTGSAPKSAKAFMYCDARGSVNDKRRFYSKITEVDYVPGEVSVIDVSAKNRATYKAYIAAAHGVLFTSDDNLHCPYSNDVAGAEHQANSNKGGDKINRIESVQTGWAPSS